MGLVSIVQTYILQLKRTGLNSALSLANEFQLYKLTSFN